MTAWLPPALGPTALWLVWLRALSPLASSPVQQDLNL